jgi:quercetin dioxygenase-like cupin family protein
MDKPFLTRPGEGERIGRRGYRHSFYMLEGEFEFLRDGEWRRIGPDTFLSVPPNVEHGFRSCGMAVRVLNFHTPNAGFIGRLREG